MKKAVFILIVIVLLIIINSLIHSIFDLWSKKDLLITAQKQLEVEKLKNAKLRGEFSYAQSQQFIDETARNKLFLVKPGEQQVLFSKDLVEKKSQTKAKNTSNWQKWFRIFF